MKDLRLGLDAGSVSVKCVVANAAGAVMDSRYRRHKGRPLQTALYLLEAIIREWGPMPATVTGTSGKRISKVLGVPHVNELMALARAVNKEYPDVRTIMEMGGEDAKLIIVEDGVVKDFALNSVCAAGTGSFLDQQAERMRLDIEAFASLALESRTPPRIAGRCSVFAKSDMIHLQQIATPLEDIVAGLCFAVARNFRGSIVRTREVLPKAAFLGGVALNQGVVRAFREVFALDHLLVPDPPTLMSALGASLHAREKGGALLDADRLTLAAQATNGGIAASRLGRLIAPGDDFLQRHERERCAGNDTPAERLNDGASVYLGIDIGSISTCLAVVDAQGELVTKRYLRTASRPIEAVRQGFAGIQEELGGGVRVRGVGTTGSGRYMIGDLVGADLVKNEITAQARGAVSLDALEGGGGVDTVFEIGGQDSKYICLQDGVIVDFEMNKACAAGTGSFLEEQAEKLAVSVKEEFAGLALEAVAPCSLGERCTVFMENSLMSALQQGAGKDDLLAGLSYSIVENYINRVVAGRPIGDKIFFQGGTACNRAVVAAFEKYLGKKIRVPRHTDVSGAIGMALLAREHMNVAGREETRFKGFDVARREYEQSSFECKGCDNRCEINRVRFLGEKDFLYYGGRCEKYDIRRQAGGHLPDLFALREESLERAHLERAEAFAASGRPARLGVLGLPRVFFMHEYLPYYATLLWELGFEVALSPRTDHKVATLGVQATLADTCFPVKAALGHVRSLLQRGVTRLFVPSFVNMARPGDDMASSLACPLTQSFPYQVRQAFAQAEVLAPVIQVRDGHFAVFTRLLTSLAPLGVRPWQLWSAMKTAAEVQRRHEDALKEHGRRVLAERDSLGVERVLVVIGRSYNAMDSGMNLGIPRKLATLNALAVPMDMLPHDLQGQVNRDWPEMYWRSGQRMLHAARVVRRDPGLHALVIGSFSCGPDSFILPYLQREMAGEPFLHIEIDEHSADAGVITRCEAYLDSLAMREQREVVAKAAAQEVRPLAHIVRRGKRRIYIPRMGDQAFGMQAAFSSCGVEAEVMPPTDDKAMDEARRFVSGKECYPFAVTTADMLKVVQAPGFRPEKSAFFMPSGNGPCRFGQYNLLQKMILERAGYPDVPILSPMQDSAMYAEFADLSGGDFARVCWIGVVAFDHLLKCLHATRPYEQTPGAADALYRDALERVPGYFSGDFDTLLEVLSRYGREFASLRVVREPKPRIGIVGEIFVRTNAYSNENLVRAVEKHGGEAWLASVDEWVYYVNWCATRSAVKRFEVPRLLQVALQDRLQRRMAHRIEASMNGALLDGSDPNTRTLLRNAAPWLHHSFQGEAVLSVGKAVDMLERGVQGVILAMPFGCMPGTVATSLLRNVCDGWNAPFINIPFDGTASSTMSLQLETFMEQAARRLRHRAAV